MIKDITIFSMAALAATFMIASETKAMTLDEAEQNDYNFISRDCGEGDNWVIYDEAEQNDPNFISRDCGEEGDDWVVYDWD